MTARITVCGVAGPSTAAPEWSIGHLTEGRTRYLAPVAELPDWYKNPPARAEAATEAATRLREAAAARDRERSSRKVTIPKEQYDELVALNAAAEGAERDRLVDQAVASCRIMDSERARWRGYLDQDPNGAAATLARLQPVILPSVDDLATEHAAEREEEAAQAAIRASFGLKPRG